MSKFVDFVNTNLEERGWTYNELARRADLSSGGISRVMTGQRNPGFDFCVGVARAFGEQPEKILRLAGLLPALPSAVAEEGEAMGLFRRLNRQAREVIVTTMRSLTGVSVPARLNDPRPTYDTPGERLAERLLDELDHLTPDDQDKVWAFMKNLRDRSERLSDGSENVSSQAD